MLSNYFLKRVIHMIVHDGIERKLKLILNIL